MRIARYGVAALRTLFVCVLFVGVTSAQPQIDDGNLNEAAAEEGAGWDFADE
jgi:hypothetical protein